MYVETSATSWTLTSRFCETHATFTGNNQHWTTWEKLTVRIIHLSNVNVQTAWKVQNETCCWFALRSLLDRKNNSHFYTFHSCLWRATSLLFDSCWHSATEYLTLYYGYNSELFCKISNWNKNKVQASYGKAPPRGPTFYPFISTIFRGKVIYLFHTTTTT